MKRITGEELDIIFKGITKNDIRPYTDIVLDAQLQADKQVVEKCRNKIADLYANKQGFKAALALHTEFADQIIKLILEEGVTDES